MSRVLSASFASLLSLVAAVALGQPRCVVPHQSFAPVVDGQLMATLPCGTTIDVAGADFALVNGDADRDNNVNLRDFSSVLADFKMSGSPVDVDESGIVGFADLSIVLLNYGIARDS